MASPIAHIINAIKYLPLSLLMLYVFLELIKLISSAKSVLFTISTF
ncbi:hypothetical protein F396_gp29 [Pectobacterium phage ZF40]|nr:hypothetical protein F396_gp29 [Pectobacterium phage ZF40]AFC22481.1 hypothetical protein ZF40_0029 [Pectobacterium phage ZF40]